MVQLTPAQRNILRVIVGETIKTKGRNAGEAKAVIDSDSFDGRSFATLLHRGLVKSYQGVLGVGFVATPEALKQLSN